MNKKVILSILLVFFLFFGTTIITNANTEEYLFYASSSEATQIGNTFTMKGTRTSVKTDVSNIDLSSTYVSVRYKDNNLDNFDIRITGKKADGSSKEVYVLTYFANEIKGNVTEFFTDNEGYKILTVKVHDELAYYGVTDIYLVNYYLRGSKGATFEIVDFTITNNGLHNFIKQDFPYTMSDIYTKTDATITKNNENEQIISYGPKGAESYSQFFIDINLYDHDNTVFEITFTPNLTTTVCFKINEKIDWSLGHKEYEGGKSHTVSLDLAYYNITEDITAFKVIIFLDGENAVEHDKKITFHNIILREPNSIEDITSKDNVSIFKNKDNSQVVKLNARADLYTLNINVVDYDPELDGLDIIFTPTKDTYISFAVNGRADEFYQFEENKTYKYTIDMKEKYKSTESKNFTINIYVEANKDKTITFHSVEFTKFEKTLNDIIKEYHNNGIYTKKSNIYLTAESERDLAIYFHGNIDKDRTTYYNGEYLLMGNYDGTIAQVDNKNNPINGINSGYRTDGSDVKHFICKENSVIDTYTVKNKTLHTMYVTLNKMNSATYFDNTWENGIHEVNDVSDVYLADFLAFAAPCLTDYVLESNYISSKGMKLQIVEEVSQYGPYLAFKIYVAEENKGAVDGGALLSEARVYKGNFCFNENVNKPENSYTTITYEESSESFLNPDIGFYDGIYITATADGNYTIPTYYLKELYENNLVHLRINIGQFSYKVNGVKDIELTTEMLTTLDNIFKTVDQSGASAIVRFAYTYEDEKDMEPNIDMILKHIEQLSPIINKYKNLITAVECGLIGPWGEMHSSAIATQEVYNLILDQYLTNLDNDVKLLVRRPEMIYKYYGLTIKTLYKFDYENNRLACYNDGYLGSSTDLGTFVNRELEITFLEKINQTNPYGGEVTVPDSDYNQLSWACDEMFKTNLSYLNIAWNDKVIQRWQETNYTLDDPLYQGLTEFNYVENHLGYRLVCEELNYKVTDTLRFNLNIKNVGFGELTKTKKAFVILVKDNSKYIYEFEYNNELNIYYNINISNLEKGNYELYFVLADDFTSSSVRGIRFANTNMYNEELKANKLATITI